MTSKVPAFMLSAGFLSISTVTICLKAFCPYHHGGHFPAVRMKETKAVYPYCHFSMRMMMSPLCMYYKKGKKPVYLSELISKLFGLLEILLGKLE